jgi:hypothetical protein
VRLHAQGQEQGAAGVGRRFLAAGKAGSWTVLGVSGSAILHAWGRLRNWQSAAAAGRS